MDGEWELITKNAGESDNHAVQKRRENLCWEQSYLYGTLLAYFPKHLNGQVTTECVNECVKCFPIDEFPVERTS
jgi:hypothetical protein